MKLKTFMERMYTGLYDESEIKKDDFVAWNFGAEGIINRKYFPKENVIKISSDFKMVQMDVSYKISQGICIEFDEAHFFYYLTRSYIESVYKGAPFEVRVFEIIDGLCYLEVKINETYSFVIQEIMDYTGELKPIKFDKIFKNISIIDDMQL